MLEYFIREGMRCARDLYKSCFETMRSEAPVKGTLAYFNRRNRQGLDLKDKAIRSTIDFLKRLDLL